MSSRHAAVLALFTSLALALMACGDKTKPQHHSTLLEVIDVNGPVVKITRGCQTDMPEEIVRWRDDETMEIATYGSVTNTGDLIQRTLDKAKHPTAYQTLFVIDFLDIQIDTNQAKWTLHGVSDSIRGEGPDIESGYDSTCKLVVTKRGKELTPGSH